MVFNLNDMLGIIPERTKGSTETIPFVALAGEVVKLETSLGGEEIAMGTVPAGKKWIGKLIISIEETDA